jgi:hypothetical protein
MTNVNAQSLCAIFPCCLALSRIPIYPVVGNKVAQALRYCQESTSRNEVEFGFNHTLSQEESSQKQGASGLVWVLAMDVAKFHSSHYAIGSGGNMLGSLGDEHQVKMVDFMKWLERPGRTPREVSQRHNIRAILGMSASR